MAELEARGVVVDRRAVRALDGVDLKIQSGEFVAIMGATGSGKSTLALVLAGALASTGGSVAGAAVGNVRLVLQRPEASFLEARVLDEVSLAARWRGDPVASAEAHAQASIARLGLPPDVAERDSIALSGGEQRRVAIAAVLASGPRVTILDEPGAGLDAAARGELHAALHELHAAGATLLLVTHDPAEAARLATRLVVLDAGRIAWDGDVAEILGDPARAQALGLDVVPEVRVLHEVAAARGLRPARSVARPEEAIGELEALLALPAGPPVEQASSGVPEPGSRDFGAATLPLPRRIDARVRLLACALAIAAALMAQSLLAAAVVTAATAIVVALARIDRARVRLAVRPLVALTVLLVLLQLLVGGDAKTELMRGTSSDLPALAALLRALQAAGVVLATLALSGATATSDLAAGLRSVLAPLRFVRVPVGSLAFVLATGLGLVPALSDELERLRLAQRARGMRPSSLGAARRLRADALLLTPLFVAAFRRAHLLADALAVRGFDPDARTRSWRPRIVPASDVALVAGGIVLVVVSRFT